MSVAVELALPPPPLLRKISKILEENIYNLYITLRIKECLHINKRKNNLIEKYAKDMK